LKNWFFFIIINTRQENKKFLRGEVQFLTGGKAREPYGRSGDIPEPTVKVWMGEGRIVIYGVIIYYYFYPISRRNGTVPSGLLFFEN